MHALCPKSFLSMASVDPTLMWSGFFGSGMSMPAATSTDARYCFDYELEFYTESKGYMSIEGKIHKIGSGDICLRKPGELVYGIMPYNCFFLIFNAAGSSPKNTMNYDFTKEQPFQANYENELLNAIPSVCHPKDTQYYHSLFDKIFKEYVNPTVTSGLKTKSWLSEILFGLYDEMTMSYGSAFQNTAAQRNIRKAAIYIQNYYQKQLSLNEMAEISGYSASHFHMLFKEGYSMTPAEYLLRVRMNAAREMLLRSDEPVGEIALSCGFDNVPYFCQVFKKFQSVTPGAYRKRHGYFIGL